MEQHLESLEASVKKLRSEIFGHGAGDDKDDSHSMQQLQFRIQTNRILQIFDNLIRTTQLIFCIPEMIHDEDLMNEMFDKKDREEVKNFCLSLITNDYEYITHKGMSQASIKLSITFEKIVRSDLKAAIPRFLDKIPPNGQDCIDRLKLLRNLAKSRIQLTAAKEMSKEKMLHKIYLENSKNEEKIQILQEKIAVQETHCQRVNSDKYSKIEKYKNEIEMMKLENKDEIARHIYDSDKRMLSQCKESDRKQADFREKVEAVTERYHKTLDANLRNERALREKKIKFTQQLQQWIAKYDVDVGTRTKELNELRSQLDEQEAKFKKWCDEEYVPQEQNYEFLMKEKEEEEQRVFEEKLWLFMMHRAARLIQKYWRQLILRRKSRKGRKGRKAKK